MTEVKSSSSSSVDALEGFLILAKTSTGGQCVMLIKEVLKHPAIYVFGELLDTPNMKQLDSTEHKPWLDVLRLFAYGTYADYKAQSASLPPLTPQHLTKLKQLSIVSMATKSKSLPYSQLIRDLDLANVRELEDMIIDCIYLDLIAGKLNQKTSRFEVSFAIGRDIGPDDVSLMIQRLEGWVAASQATLVELEKKQQQANATHEQVKKDEESLETKKKDILETLKAQKEAGVDEDGRGGKRERRAGAKGSASSVAAAAGAGLRSIFGGSSRH